MLAPNAACQDSSHTLSAECPTISEAFNVVAAGGNNARDTLAAIAGGAGPTATITSAATNYATDIAGTVQQLRTAGAQNIVV